MWWVHGRLDFTVLPPRRNVLEFQFRDDGRHFWIVKDSSGPSVCTSDPGFDIDMCVRTDVATLYRIWLGTLDLRDAQRHGSLTLDGPPALIRRVPELFLLSPMAFTVAATRT
jgi:hypothetical protein